MLKCPKGYRENKEGECIKTGSTNNNTVKKRGSSNSSKYHSILNSETH